MPDRLSVSQYVANPNLSTELPGVGYAIASGGATVANITSYGIAYRLHTFTASANLTVDRPGYIDILLIGAGGAGGNPNGIGGGGGGGDLTFVYRQFVPAGTYPIVIGAGVADTFRQGGRTRITSSDNNNIVFIAYGGGAGSYLGGMSPYGGSAGGGGTYGGAQGGGNPQWCNFGNAGGTAPSGSAAGGGGGAGTAASGATGGNGVDISLWLGQSANTTIRCGGGAGTGGAAGTGTGAANTGGGFNAGTSTNAGYSGIAYVRSAPQ